MIVAVPVFVLSYTLVAVTMIKFPAWTPGVVVDATTSPVLPSAFVNSTTGAVVNPYFPDFSVKVQFGDVPPIEKSSVIVAVLSADFKAAICFATLSSSAETVYSTPLTLKTSPVASI